MAKALLGYVSVGDPRVAARLATDNKMLRERVGELEATVVRLQSENDALAVLAAERHQDVLATV